jgi:prevent-host-death family protein
MSMKVISSREAQNAFGAFLDAAQNEPILVTRRNRPVGVMLPLGNLPALIEIADTMRDEIKGGINAGLADVEAGRVHELTDEFIEELSHEAQARITHKKTA